LPYHIALNNNNNTEKVYAANITDINIKPTYKCTCNPNACLIRQPAVHGPGGIGSFSSCPYSSARPRVGGNSRKLVLRHYDVVASDSHVKCEGESCSDGSTTHWHQVWLRRHYRYYRPTRSRPHSMPCVQTAFHFHPRVGLSSLDLHSVHLPTVAIYVFLLFINSSLPILAQNADYLSIPSMFIVIIIIIIGLFQARSP